MKRFALALVLLIAALVPTLASAQSNIGNFSQIRIDGTCRVDSGSGAPEGAVTAPVCSIYLRTDGGVGTSFCTKTSGSGNTGWTCLSGAGGTVTTSGSPANGNLAKFTSATAISNADLTGDVTTSGTVATTIASDAVTNAKAANMVQSTIKGRAVSAGTGDPTDLTATQATAILDNVVGDSGSGGTKGLVPAPASGDTAAGKFLKADGTWSAPSGSGAPSSAQYVTLALDSGLSAERVLTAGTGISLTDGGANGNITVANTAVAGMEWIADGTPSGTGVVTFSSLGSFRHLEIRYSARGDQSATSTLVNCQFNGDTGSNYDRQHMNAAGATTPTAAESLAQTSAACGLVSAATAAANEPGTGTIAIYDYRGTTFEKQGTTILGYKTATSSGGFNIRTMAFAWRSTAAITSITLTLASGNYVTGSVFSLYGLR